MFIKYYETMFLFFITAFNLNIIESVYERKKPSKIFGNYLPHTAFFVFFEVVKLYFNFAIITTMVYLFKKAVISFQDTIGINCYWMN